MVTAFIRTLFSTTGLLIVIYIVIGVFVNTASPHLPTTAGNISLFHSWVQYFVGVPVAAELLEAHVHRGQVARLIPG